MINKKDLLKDIRKYSPEQIAKAVQSGEVSMYQLSKETEGAFTPLLKRHVKEILERPIQPEQKEKTEISSSDTNVENSADKESSNSMEILPPEIPFEDEPNIESILSEVEDTSSPDDDVEIPLSDTEHNMFSHPFSFKGRIRRSEYWLTLLISFFIYFGINLAIVAAERNSSNDPLALLVLLLIIIVPYLWFVWAQAAKRCHDRGNSGFFQLIPFYFLWMLFAEGNSKTNEYGNSPK